MPPRAPGSLGCKVALIPVPMVMVPSQGLWGTGGHGAEGLAWRQACVECWSIVARSVQPTALHAGSGAWPESTVIPVSLNPRLSRLNVTPIVL